MNKNIALFVIGKQPIEKGLRILGAHIDSPRLDLKQNPLYESEGFALLIHTIMEVWKISMGYNSFIYDWSSGEKDGTVIDVNIGEDENDPVVGISDLLVHLSADQLKKRLLR